MEKHCSAILRQMSLLYRQKSIGTRGAPRTEADPYERAGENVDGPEYGEQTSSQRPLSLFWISHQSSRINKPLTLRVGFLPLKLHQSLAIQILHFLQCLLTVFCGGQQICVSVASWHLSNWVERSNNLTFVSMHPHFGSKTEDSLTFLQTDWVPEWVELWVSSKMFTNNVMSETSFFFSSFFFNPDYLLEVG